MPAVRGPVFSVALRAPHRVASGSGSVPMTSVITSPTAPGRVGHGTAATIDRRDAAHLLNRVGFGGSIADIDALASSGDWTTAVDRMLDTSRAPGVSPPPELRDPAKNGYQRWVAATQWWVDRMATTPAPLVERMVLFFHNHFVSGTDKVDITLLFDQHQLFRTGGLGNYHDLVQRMAVDPAMLVYLDNAVNVAGSENENFAREVMELFTMGNFTFAESDVISMARAWTGHGLNKERTKYEFHADRHDNGDKTLFGITRNWNGPEALTEIVTGSKKQVAAEFLTAKLWSYFAYPKPAAALVTELANQFVASGHDLKALVRSILLHPEFRSPAARRALVRSPIEWLVAGQKAVKLPAAVTHPEWYLANMGQEPFRPPNVSGWRQNGYWISTSAYWARGAWAGYVRWKASETGVFAGVENLTPQLAVQTAFDRFGVVEPDPQTRKVLEAWVTAERSAKRGWSVHPNLITLLLLSPDFQVA
jgi:hypothetical protein